MHYYFLSNDLKLKESDAWKKYCFIIFEPIILQNRVQRYDIEKEFSNKRKKTFYRQVQ